MPLLEECCVLIPCNTLEDFPAELSESHAKGLLGAWTAAWHPKLIAATGKIPAWYRADTPPPAVAGRVFFIPEVSADRLPQEFHSDLGSENEAIILRESSRANFLTATQWQALGIELAAGDAPAIAAEASSLVLTEGHRPVGPDDFFALAYTMLQVQLMTRQLRYTSNLDEVDFGDRVVKAARAWEAGDGEPAAESLHSAFDMLAEERDHYFASDPHLVDLTLLAETTLGEPLAQTLAHPSCTNLLFNAELAEQLQQSRPELIEQIKSRVADGSLGLAGGAAGSERSLDHLTASEAAEWVAIGKRRFEGVFGCMPDAFAKFDGGVPGDFVQWLVEAGYRGAIPLDFLRGTGYRDESKLHWQSGAAELESLVAKPINAAESAPFLKLGAALGSGVDCGDVATALLVHWPGESCESYEDLRRAAEWGLALGRFWTLGGYFNDGEKPYHHFQTSSTDADGNWLTATIDARRLDPLSTAAEQVRSRIEKESQHISLATRALVAGQAIPANAPSTGVATPSTFAATSAELAKQLVQLSGKPARSEAKTIINPHSIPLRVAVQVKGHPPRAGAPVFAAHSIGRHSSMAFVDVPAHGFATVSPGKQAPRRRWFRRRKLIGSGQTLGNEFMEVTIADDGSVASVHSGPVRGNRFSWQLCQGAASQEAPRTKMQCERIELTESNAAFGEITCRGTLVDGNQTVARFVVHYRLECGSRFLQIAGEIDNPQPLTATPWRSFYAGRCAVASDASTAKVIVRDKIHRSRGRRLDAPQGVIIDEGDRKLLVVADGLPSHRFSSRRMLDTLLLVEGESLRRFRLRYGFDVKHPVATARAILCPPAVVEQPGHAPSTPAGWLMQVESRRVLITDCRRELGSDDATFVLRLVETSGKFVKSRLRLFRDPIAAVRVLDGKSLEVAGDAVAFALSGHETTEIRVTVS